MTTPIETTEQERIPTATAVNQATEMKTNSKAEIASDLSPNGLPRLAYTMRETAEILGVSYITVHRLLKRGKLRACDALRNKVIPRTEIERFLRQSTKAA